MRFLLISIVLFVSSPALMAQQPIVWASPLPATNAAPPPEALPITAGQPPAPPVPDGLPSRFVAALDAPLLAGGQQHWLALNFALGQPSIGRVAVKVWDRPNNSLWLEAYGGSALFNGMYGFGARVQHSAFNLGNGDNFFISPGLGVHILPEWYDVNEVAHFNRRHGYWYTGNARYTTLSYLAGDVDFSWLHDFSPRFGFELGLKVGIAGRLSGAVGDDYPSGVMWGRNFYPIVAMYSGIRF
jgi:hypothetical protein